jgi:hypothetical protein
MQNELLDTVIRRTVSIPKRASSGESILAVIDMGGKLLNKEMIYQKFFEYGLNGVKNLLKEEVKSRGGNDATFAKILSDMNKKYEPTKVKVSKSIPKN